MTKMEVYLWHCTVAKNALEHSNRSSNDDVITDVLHNGRCLSGNKSQQDRCLVEVPEQKQLATTRRRAADVTKQVRIWVPEYPIKAQHHLAMHGNKPSGFEDENFFQKKSCKNFRTIFQDKYAGKLCSVNSMNVKNS